MRRQLNYDLLLFHVREASQELDTLLLRIRKMLGELEEPLSEADKAILAVYDRPLEEAGLKVSLEHAYHHLNFAWNVRYKDTNEADKHFDRGEKFPRAFSRFWPKAMRRKRRQNTLHTMKKGGVKKDETRFDIFFSVLYAWEHFCAADDAVV